jgi:hypothetical protein
MHRPGVLTTQPLAQRRSASLITALFGHQNSCTDGWILEFSRRKWERIQCALAVVDAMRTVSICSNASTLLWTNFDNQMTKMKESLLKDRMVRAVVNGFMSNEHDLPCCPLQTSPLYWEQITIYTISNWMPRILENGSHPVGLPPHSMGRHNLKTMDCTAAPEVWQNTQMQTPSQTCRIFSYTGMRLIWSLLE